MENKKTPYQIDQNTYNELQKLKEFVKFVASHKSCYYDKEKKHAEEIISLISTIDQLDTHKRWAVEFRIEDDFIDEEDEGFFLREWTVFFEAGELSIEARSVHTAILDDMWKDHYGDDLHYTGSVLFVEVEGKQVYLERDITDFVKDAIDYKKYITPTMNDIEIEIDVW